MQNDVFELKCQQVLLRKETEALRAELDALKQEIFMDKLKRGEIPRMSYCDGMILHHG